MTNTLTIHDFALYLGAPCECKSIVSKMNMQGTVDSVSNLLRVAGYMWEPSQCTLILRHLDSLTEPEARELFFAANGKTWNETASCLEGWNKEKGTVIIDVVKLTIGDHKAWRWLLAHHFDLFGWIEAGLALDASKLETT